jgi:hypothetical protein
MIADERDDWKQLDLYRSGFAIVEAEEVENMFFHKYPWCCVAFHRTSQLLPPPVAQTF